MRGATKWFPSAPVVVLETFLPDILFGMLLTEPLRLLQVDLEEQGLIPTLQTAGVLSPSPNQPLGAPLASWHDDLF